MNEELLQMLEWQEDRYPHALEEKFPRILEKIMEMWGAPELDQYFNELMMDTRGGTRQGFPPDVASEIFSLSMVHSEQMTNR
jgi:uncharacterized protein